MRSDLAVYLLARLDEDERDVRAFQDQSSSMEAVHDAAEAGIEADLRVVLRAGEVDDPAPAEEYRRFVLPAHSLPYADRPDHREEWRALPTGPAVDHR